MGGPYNIPRNYKGESKILFIFSTKSFIYTAIGAIIGIGLNYLFGFLKIRYIGVVCILLFGILGFILGTLKIPEISGMKFTQKVGGEYLDEIIKRWIKFKFVNKKKIYVYKEVPKNVK